MLSTVGSRDAVRAERYDWICWGSWEGKDEEGRGVEEGGMVVGVRVGGAGRGIWVVGCLRRDSQVWRSAFRLHIINPIC